MLDRKLAAGELTPVDGASATELARDLPVVAAAVAHFETVRAVGRGGPPVTQESARGRWGEAARLSLLRRGDLLER
jgi:hypothetical protein